jgi:hypothetical protein
MTRQPLRNRTEETMRSHFSTIIVALAVLCFSATGPASAAPKDEIRTTFSKFVDAQNAHDLMAVGILLDDGADFLWTTPGHVVRSREAALARFRDAFQGIWRIQPDWSTYQTLRLDISTIEVFVRAAVSSGAPARAARLNVVLVNTAHGWRVLTFVVSDLPPA